MIEFRLVLPFPRAQPCVIDFMGNSRYKRVMDWRGRIILSKLSEGCLVAEAATAAGIHRQTIWRWVKCSPEFAQSVIEARKTGEKERTYRLWLNHPFRGMRPPTGKGNGGKPRFSYGRR